MGARRGARAFRHRGRSARSVRPASEGGGITSGWLQFQKLSDAALVGLALAGNDRALCELFRRHDARVRCCVAKPLGPLGSCSANVDDVLQHAREKVFRELRRLRCHEHFGAWYAKIAVNEARSLLRSRGARPEDGAGSPDDLEGLPHQRPRRVDRVEARSTIRAVLSQLPQRRREVFLLFHRDGLRYGEIAERLGVRVGTVAATLHAARQQIDEILLHLE